MTAVRESAAESAPPPPPPPAPESQEAANSAAEAGAAGGGAATRRPPPGGYRRRPSVTPGRLAAGTLGASLLIVAVTALGFTAWVGLFSQLHYDKAQLNAYDALRVELAAGTAPNGPTVPNNPAKLLPLGAPVAVLSIPAIGLRTVVLQGTTGAVLENGPGHLRTSVMPGQAAGTLKYPQLFSGTSLA